NELSIKYKCFYILSLLLNSFTKSSIAKPPYDFLDYHFSLINKVPAFCHGKDLLEFLYSIVIFSLLFTSNRIPLYNSSTVNLLPSIFTIIVCPLFLLLKKDLIKTIPSPGFS